MTKVTFPRSLVSLIKFFLLLTISLNSPTFAQKNSPSPIKKTVLTGPAKPSTQLIKKEPSNKHITIKGIVTATQDNSQDALLRVGARLNFRRMSCDKCKVETAVSDENGNYEINLKEGNYELVVEEDTEEEKNHDMLAPDQPRHIKAFSPQSGETIGFNIRLNYPLDAFHRDNILPPTQDEDKKWINVPSTPLLIEESISGRVMMLTNISSGDIVQYRFGCVTGNDDTRVPVRLPAVDVSLSAYDPINGLRKSEIFVLPENLLLTCKQTNAKIAVVEVVFKAGNKWTAENDFK